MEKKKTFGKAGITMLLIPLSILLFAACGGKKAETVIPEAIVSHGTFLVDIYEEGEVEALNSTHIMAPEIPWRFGGLKIAQIVPDGSDVKAGDTVVVFDPSEVQKAILDHEDRLVVSLAELEKLRAQQTQEMEGLNADYEIAQIAQEISRIELEGAAYESEIRRKEIELNLEKAEISLKQAKEQIENRKKVQAEDLKQKKISIEQDRDQLREAYETLGRLYVVSPQPGLAIINRNRSTDTKYQVSDQCWGGTQLIDLPDLSKMKVKININEVDISKVSKGMEAEIRPDAYSDSVFTGHVLSIANLAVNKERNSTIKVFPVEVLVDRADENLLPGLTISCRIIVDRIPDVDYVPIEAVHLEGDKSYVFRATATGYERVDVETGPTNTNYVIISSGLRKGDRVALVDPTVKAEKSKKKQGGTEK